MTRVIFFANDIAEAAQIRRIQGIRALGHEVTSISFRRDNMNEAFDPDWRDVNIGRTQNNRLFQRVLKLGVGVVRTCRARRFLDDSDVWVARNFDMLAIACAVRFLLGRHQVRLVYECLDIHGLFTRDDVIGRAMRWMERRLLARTALLVVSSPGFLRAYFTPVQHYVGKTALIENKLWLGDRPVPRPAPPVMRDPDAPLVLGWVGSLRCADSLSLLAAAAEALGPQIRIVFHGNVHRNAVPDFDAIVGQLRNVEYKGPYAYPDGLRRIYGACDLVWAQDLWQRGANSDWLLPNRIYEASFYGCPSIAVSGTETGRRVAATGLGFVIAEPSAKDLIALLRSLTPDEIAAAAQRILAKEDREFRLFPDELQDHLSPVLSPRERHAA